ncbi:MAG: radical SAM protein [Sphingobacteriaceae bacterium]|nr:radical SAM protein [Sphingobacteriaceae bacterium]
MLPLDNKICNFNCIYCECGWTDLRSVESKFIAKDIIVAAMKERFSELSTVKEKPQAITFAGNGEPTMHPDFAWIMDETIRLRNEYLPGVKIVVLSNSALLGKKDVMTALKKADLRVMKLDAGTEEQFDLIDQPLSRKKLPWYINKLKEFNGDLYIQTMFLKGIHEKAFVDNTTDNEVQCWINILKEVQPKLVMIYTIDRETPAKELNKISEELLNKICEKVKLAGIDAKVFN